MKKLWVEMCECFLKHALIALAPKQT